MFFQLVSYIGTFLGFAFLTLSIASGLFYLSELVEEHSEFTKRFLTRSILAIIATYILLWLFDGFPFLLTVFSIATNVVYLQNLKRFPYISLTSPVFLASCVLVIVNHFLWFRYFNSRTVLPPPEIRMRADYVAPKIPSFAEVASFYGLCIWFIPFALFVSLSVADNMLPSMKDPTETPGRSGSSAGLMVDDDSSVSKVKRHSMGLVKLVMAKAKEFLDMAVEVVSTALGKSSGRRQGLI